MVGSESPADSKQLPGPPSPPAQFLRVEDVGLDLCLGGRGDNERVHVRPPALVWTQESRVAKQVGRQVPEVDCAGRGWAVCSSPRSALAGQEVLGRSLLPELPQSLLEEAKSHACPAG